MVRQLRLLDLFCCEGGACAGYQRADWEVYGLDMAARFVKRYPGAGFCCGNALEALFAILRGEKIEFICPDGTTRQFGLLDFDAIHASPPCQGYTRGNAGRETDWPKLIPWNGLFECLPPAFTEHIGSQLAECVTKGREEREAA